MAEPETNQADIKTDPMVGSRTERINALEQELGQTKRRYNLVIQIVSSVFALAMLTILMLLVWADVVSFYRASIRPLLQYWPNAVAVFALPVIAFNLYNLKQYRPTLFGILEVIVAALLIWAGMNKIMMASYELATLLLLAGLYISASGIGQLVGQESGRNN